MQNLAKLQKEYSAAMAAGVVGVSRIQERFEAEMTRHLSYKAQLLNPPLIEMAFQFYVATARWLTQLATGVDIGMDGNVEMESLKTLSTGLCHVPEFVAENLVQFIIFVRQYSETTLELMGDHLPYLLTFITVFMGNPDFVRNPHLRATMAEMLYLLMPQINEADKVSLRAAPMDIQRVRLFENHSFAHLHLIRALLHVFIDIEFTGHHNEFGQKLSESKA
jgi:ubiquitin conjugation factor E4 B